MASPYKDLKGNLSTAFYLNKGGKGWLELSADPTTGGGVVAPEGSLGVYKDGSSIGSIWLKYGTANTAWKPVGSRAYSVASSNPGATNDGVDTAAIGRNFNVGDLWLNISAVSVYICFNNTTSAAVWKLIYSGSGSVFSYDYTIKTSGGTITWSGSAGNYYGTMTAATHGLSPTNKYRIKVVCYKLLNSLYTQVIPAKVEINSSGDVVIYMPDNDNLYVSLSI